MLQDNIIQEVTPIIFAKALSYMKQREDAEDIVQIVLMKIWADREKIAKEAAVSWALKVTRNDCINELRKKKKIIFVNFDDVEKQVSEKLMKEDNQDFAEELDKINNLKTKEKKLLKYYIEEGHRIKHLAKKKRLNYEAVKKQLYKLKRNIRAEHYIDLGMIGSRKMVDYNFNQNILKFINKLNSCLLNNDLHKMQSYFGRRVDKNEIPEIRISKINQYDIRISGKKQYLIFIHYFDDNGEFNSFFFEVLNKGNHSPLQITALPKLAKSIKMYSEADISKTDKEIILEMHTRRGTLLQNKDNRYKTFKNYKPIKVIENK